MPPRTMNSRRGGPDSHEIVAELAAVERHGSERATADRSATKLLVIGMDRRCRELHARLLLEIIENDRAGLQEHIHALVGRVLAEHRGEIGPRGLDRIRRSSAPPLPVARDPDGAGGGCGRAAHHVRLLAEDNAEPFEGADQRRRHAPRTCANDQQVGLDVPDAIGLRHPTLLRSGARPLDHGPARRERPACPCYGIDGLRQLNGRDLDADGQAVGHGLRQSDEIDAALAWKHPFLACGMNELLGRRRAFGRTVAELPVVKLLRRDSLDIRKRALRSIEMQRIDQNAGRGVIDIGDDPHRGLQVRNAGPGHEFEIGCQAVLCSRFAKLPVAVREPCQVRIVGRNENMFGAEARARLEEGREGRDVRRRPERDDFEIGDGHARRLQPLQRLRICGASSIRR